MNELKFSARAPERIRLYCTTYDRYPIKWVDVVELFMNELSERGLSQHWFSQGRASPGPFRVEQINEVPVTISPATGRFGAVGTAINVLTEWVVDTFCLARLVFSPVDVIQVRDKYWAALVAWPVARISGALYTIWLSFPYPEADIDRAANHGLLKKLYLLLNGHLGQQLLYRFAMHRADHCFVQTEEMKQSLIRRGIPADKMTPVPMGITPRVLDFRRQRKGETCSHEDRALVDRFIDSDAPTVFYLGTLDRSRELTLVIDAFALVLTEFPKARLLMVGSASNPADSQMLVEHAQRLGIAEQVVFTGFLPIERAWALLEHAHVCWSPIVNNRVLRVGSPTKLIEYMAFQKPVVANEHPEHEAVLGTSGAGFCVPWSAAGFADATKSLLADPVAARAMGMKGLPWVEQNRTYDRLADAVMLKYESLLSGRARSGTSNRLHNRNR